MELKQQSKAQLDVRKLSPSKDPTYCGKTAKVTG
jgi:hypothetical protein